MKIASKKQFDQTNKKESKFMDLQTGDNRVRVVSEIFGVIEHRVENINGEFKSIACPIRMEQWKASEEERDANPDVACPICEKPEGQESLKRSYLAVVLDRASGSVKVLKRGPTVFEPIFSFMDDPDYGDPTQYDIKINKKGEKLLTEYSVIPTPNKSPLTKAEQDLVTNANIDLTKWTEPRSYDEIVEVLNGNDPYNKK